MLGPNNEFSLNYSFSNDASVSIEKMMQKQNFRLMTAILLAVVCFFGGFRQCAVKKALEIVKFLPFTS